jgi:asparagine synthase (glutamine-hydrolysing)
MCGISFIYGETDNKESRMRESLRLLDHRGPDESNLVMKGKACLGHVRLSIIDLVGSRQPMHSPDDRYSLIYNGEIYNYSELKQRLERNWRFITNGDTEVLLAGLILEGEDFISRLEGMWAFALWDARDESLLMSRDRMGKKPLYYVSTKQGMCCSSELPALKALTDFSWLEDIDSTADYFRYGYCLPGYTSWKNVFEVLPGNWLRWRPKVDVEQRAYWQLPYPVSESQAPGSDELVDALTNAVRKRLIADVEVGAFLSGGVDSSLICALAQPMMGHQLKTYTIGFSDRTYDERNYAERVARHIGTDHREEVLSGWDESRLELLLAKHLGQPFADASLLPTALVSELAARDLKVVLSGDGGDELFGGYQRYQARILLRWYTRLPEKLRKYAEMALRSLPEPGAHHSRSILKKAHLFLDIVGRYRAETPYTASLMFRPDDYERLFPGLVGYGHLPPNLLEETGLEDLQRMLYADALVYLPQDILVKVDRASMSQSLESRAPLLDHKVVELAYSLPADSHCRLGSGKRWLKKAFVNSLPEFVWKRRKQGFGVPLHEWFRGDLGDRFNDLLNDTPGYLNPEALRMLLHEHQSGNRDHGYRLWIVYIYLTRKRFCLNEH